MTSPFRADRLQLRYERRQHHPDRQRGSTRRRLRQLQQPSRVR